jgi:allantoicase
MHDEIPSGLTNLAEDALGAQALWATDDFFAPKERLLLRAEPISKPGTFDDNGQWMDGWESRRRRGGGHDACIVRLAFPGLIRLIDIDTRFFTGNYPPQAAVEATNDDDPLAAKAKWTPLLATRALRGNSHNRFPVENETSWRFVRLNIFPDGGVARLRVWGVVQPDWKTIGEDRTVDLFAVEHGGIALQANDQHYGHIRNLNRPGRGVNMGDGWETRRRREPGFDWAIVKLGRPGIIEAVEIDTAHFRGNYPDRVSLQAALVKGVGDAALAEQSTRWLHLLPEQQMSADMQHRFKSEVSRLGTVSHVRINMHPDGGISRVRLYGRISRT